MATVTVSNKTELMAALNNATSNTTILMAKGSYDNLYISGNKIPELSNNASVTLKSLDANNPATITNMILIGADNVTFDSIKFDYTAATGAGVSVRPFMLLSSDNITVKNSVFDGDLAKGVSATTNGYGTGIALGVKDTSNLTVVDNTFVNFHKAVVVERGSNFVVSRNDISGMASDGVNFSGITNATIADNHFHDFASHPNTNAHKDMIQFWSIGNSEASKNVTITGNVLNSGAGTFTQSILIAADNGKTFTDFQIKDNLIHNGFTHGITLDNIRNVVVSNNTVLHNVDSSVNSTGLYVPKIHIGTQVQNATVSDNIAHAISGTNWNGSGNLIVQNTNPGQANYYGDLFVNGLAGANATAADLAALPGSIIDTTNVGASITQPGGNGNALTASGGSSGNSSSSGTANALLLSKEGTELAKGTVDFDITNITNGSSSLNTNGAKVVWDYGDGNTGTGLTSSHHYAHAGSYQVKATVTLKDGTKLTAQKSLSVDTPIALSSDFQNGAVDQSDIVNGVKTSGSVQFINDQGSKVAKLGTNGTITYARSAELFDNTAYTVMADFRKDNLSDSGKLISFANSFVVQIKQGSVYVSITTDKGTKWINTGANVYDTNWHKLALTFSGSSGKAELYLDGKSIGTATGLQGATQVGNKVHDFHVGSNTGGSFPGLVDNVAFLTGDLSASDISSLHAGSTTVPTLLGSAINTSTGGSSSVGGSAQQPTTPTTPTDTSGSNTDTGGNSASGGSTGSSTGGSSSGSGGSTGGNTATSGATAILADFEKGFADQSSVANAASTKGWVKIVSDQGSKVARLSDNSYITYKDTPDLYNNKAYTVMADFRKDHASDEGKLISFGYSFGIQVKKDSIAVSVTTDKGTKWISTKADVNDTSWHKVALTFDSGSGKAVLYLDGQSIGQITGLKGATQKGNATHDFHVGSPTGNSFDGLVDNVTFLTNDLSAAEIKSVHAGTTSIGSVGGSGSSGSGSSGSSGGGTVTGAPTTPTVDTGGSTSGSSGNAGGSFSYTMTAKNTKVQLDNAKQGIIDQAYLSGDTASSFNVKVIDTKSTAYFNNALGVYEIDAKGRIVDVRMLDTDAQTGNGTIKVTGVDKGHDLGFFIVQDGYNRMDKALGGNNLSLQVENGNIVLKSGSATLTKKVFVSHDKNLNYDNHQHVASMDNPNTNGAIIAFEDQHKGGRGNDLNDVVFEVTAIGADHLDFA